MTKDRFLSLERPERIRTKVEKTVAQAGHGERAHSKFAASAAERWFNCQGSVELSEGLPDKTSAASLEGTAAHELLETVLLAEIEGTPEARARMKAALAASPPEMGRHAIISAQRILNLWRDQPDADIQVETRVYLDFIHPEMFGTFDGAVIDHFGTLDVFDFKYGKHPVSPKQNLQMIFYGIGLAHLHHWNFKDVRLWIIQPRARGFDGPVYWGLSIHELKSQVEKFQRAVDRVEQFPKNYAEGEWCYFCKAKSICPLKRDAREQEAKLLFSY